MKYTTDDLRKLHAERWREQQITLHGRSHGEMWKEDLMQTKGKEKGWPVRYDWHQWYGIVDCIARDGLVAVIENSFGGFNANLYVYTPNAALFPGVEPEPDLVLIVSHMHLPHKFRPSFDESWAAFEPVARSDEMRARAARDDYELREKSAYEY